MQIADQLIIQNSNFSQGNWSKEDFKKNHFVLIKNSAHCGVCFIQVEGD